MKRLVLLSLTLLWLATAGYGSTNVTLHLKTVSQQAVTSNTYVLFELQNCQGNQPRVSSVGWIDPQLSVKPDATGLVTVTVYSNSEITCASAGDTRWRVTWYRGTSPIATGRTYTINGADLDLDTVMPDSVFPTTIPTALGIDLSNYAITRPFRHLAFADFPATCDPLRDWIERSDPDVPGEYLYRCKSTGDGFELNGKNPTQTVSFVVLDPSILDTGKVQFPFAQAGHIRKVWCSVDAGSASIQIQRRLDANLAGPSALSEDLQCTANGTTSCASGCNVNTISDGDFAASNILDLELTSVVSSPTVLRVFAEVYYSDSLAPSLTTTLPPASDDIYQRLDGANAAQGNYVPDSNGVRSLGATLARWNAFLHNISTDSTTLVANLNADKLQGFDWAVPNVLGATTPNAMHFSTLFDSAGHSLADITQSGTGPLLRQSEPAITRPVLTTPSIGGETISKAPRMVWSMFVPTASTTLSIVSQWTLDQAITVTRMQMQLGTALSSCSPAPTYTLTDGTTSQAQTLANTTLGYDSGAITKSYPAGATLKIQSAAGTSCIGGTNLRINVQYEMQ